MLILQFTTFPTTTLTWLKYHLHEESWACSFRLLVRNYSSFSNPMCQALIWQMIVLLFHFVLRTTIWDRHHIPSRYLKNRGWEVIWLAQGHTAKMWHLGCGTCAHSLLPSSCPHSRPDGLTPAGARAQWLSAQGLVCGCPSHRAALGMKGISKHETAQSTISTPCKH